MRTRAARDERDFLTARADTIQVQAALLAHPAVATRFRICECRGGGSRSISLQIIHARVFVTTDTLAYACELIAGLRYIGTDMDLSKLQKLLATYKRGELQNRRKPHNELATCNTKTSATRASIMRIISPGILRKSCLAPARRGNKLGIVERLIQHAPNVIVTRTDAATFGEVRNIVTEAEWHESARLIRILRDQTERGVGEIVVVTAGTSDIPVAEEAALTAEAMGNRVKRVWDVGVAGIHRVLAERSILADAALSLVPENSYQPRRLVPLSFRDNITNFAKRGCVRPRDNHIWRSAGSTAPRYQNLFPRLAAPNKLCGNPCRERA